MRTISVGSGALLHGALRVVCWYVDAGSATPVGTTSEAASAGPFEDNAAVLDNIVASAVSFPATGGDPG